MHITSFLENNKNILLKKFTYIFLLKYTLNTPKINDLYIGMTILPRLALPQPAKVVGRGWGNICPRTLGPSGDRFNIFRRKHHFGLYILGSRSIWSLHFESSQFYPCYFQVTINLVPTVR